MKFRRQLKDEVAVNLTPLIDVVFLLLIFFMVTTTFERESRLQVDLPEAEGEAAQVAPEALEILVGRDGSYAINGQRLVNNSTETLMRALREASGGDTALPLLISADALSSHQAVVSAMDAAGRLGFSRLNIATREADESP